MAFKEKKKRNEFYVESCVFQINYFGKVKVSNFVAEWKWYKRLICKDFLRKSLLYFINVHSLGI